MLPKVRYSMNSIVKYLRRNINIDELIASGDKEKMKRTLLSKRAILTPGEKGKLIVGIGDPEFMKACVRDITLRLDKSNLSWIIAKTGDGNYIESRARSMKFRRDSYYKSYLIRSTNDIERMKKYLSDEYIKSKDKCEWILRLYSSEEIIELIESNGLGLDSESKRILITRLPDIYKMKCLGNEKLGLDAYDRGILINSIHLKERREQFDYLFLDVDKISEMSLEDLEHLPDDGIVRIKNSKKEGKTDYYSKAEFRAIKKVTDKILDGIERPEKNDEASELAVFKTICKRLAKHMSYDNAAIRKKNEKNSKWQRDCRNLYGGLVQGKTVCAGYAYILAQMLTELGMEAQYIRGDDGKVGHAWTQVKIGGKWFNTDLTWERDSILLMRGKVSTRVLKSDRQFKNHNKYSNNRTIREHQCVNSVNGIFNPKISAKEDVELGEKVKAMCERFCISTSDLKSSYKNLLKAVNFDNKRRKNKEQENSTEIS